MQGLNLNDNQDCKFVSLEEVRKENLKNRDYKEIEQKVEVISKSLGRFKKDTVL